jgi:hypothetical protein
MGTILKLLHYVPSLSMHDGIIAPKSKADLAQSDGSRGVQLPSRRPRSR